MKTPQKRAGWLYRGKAQQKVTVEHVHVHSGGQAIVGAVTPGGGGHEKSQEQGHAPRGISGGAIAAGANYPT